MTAQKYDLKNFVVLVADGSEVMRSLLASTLKNIGVGRVSFAFDGSGTIGYLKASKVSSSDNLTYPADIVISDISMDQVDGMMLLRWIRRHEDSPNHFMPVVLTSSSPDKDSIGQARNMGANAFLAKPFSAKSLTKLIADLIENPRDFVRTKTYFGPDRRTYKNDVSKMERRHISGATGDEFWDKDNPDVVILRIPNVLKAKTLTSAKGSQEEAPTAFDPSMLEYAHTQMEKWTEDYSDWAMENTSNLIALYKCVATKTGPEQDQALIKVKEIISDLKSHGREFGYPLISEIATSLSSIASNVQITRRHLALFGNHIDALRVVSRKRIKGAGGDVGRELIGSLHKADAKLKVVH